MYYYLIGAIIILILLIFVMIYLYKKTNIITIIDKVKNKYLRFIIRIILIIIPFFVFGFINGVVVLLHFAFFFLIFDFINLFVKNKTNLFNYLAIILRYNCILFTIINIVINIPIVNRYVCILLLD